MKRIRELVQILAADCPADGVLLFFRGAGGGCTKRGSRYEARPHEGSVSLWANRDAILRRTARHNAGCHLNLPCSIVQQQPRDRQWDVTQKMSSSEPLTSPVPGLRSQWSNPGDILSLLLLIGGDIVQKALAQFVGVTVKLPGKRGPAVLVTPVAFSFGWVAYAFMSLMSVFGDNALIPEPDCRSIVVNCKNGYVRENRSWVLGRILRDYESSHEVDKATEALRIDIFEVKPCDRPKIDMKWVLGCAVIMAQQVIGSIPWILYGDWSIWMITVAGTLGALMTGSLSQWLDEKWPGRPMGSCQKVMALTRGNGHRHVLVIVSPGGVGWDLESMATASGASQRTTRVAFVLLSLWWTLLLITVSGLKQNTWFLIAVGGIGMVQNIYVAGARREPEAFNIPLERVQGCSTIIGKVKRRKAWSESTTTDDVSINEDEELEMPSDRSALSGIMEALMMLETRFERAGASLLDVFFPAGLKYETSRHLTNTEKKFWKHVFYRAGLNTASESKGVQVELVQQ